MDEVLHSGRAEPRHDPEMEAAMARALILIHGCAGLIREGWPPVGLPWERLVGLFSDGRSAR